MRRLAPSFALAALTVAAYANAMNGGFHFDDMHAVVENPSIRSLDNLGRFFTDGRMFTVLPQDQEYRPMVLVSYALTARLFGMGARPFLAGNLLIHVLCVLAMYATLRRVRALLGRPSGPVDGAAFIAAALFAVHPLFSECVNYVHARSESLAALFSLLALYAYLQARVLEGTHGADRWLIVAALSVFAGMFSKVTAGVVPFLALLLERAAHQPSPPKAVWQRWFVLAFPVAVFSLIYVRLSSPFAVASRSNFTRAEYLYSSLPAIFHYVRLFLWPTGQSADADYPVAHTPFEARVMVAAALLVLAVVFAAVALTRRRFAAAGLVISWFLVCLAPTTSIFPLGEIVNEHRPYIAAMALCAVAGDWLFHIAPPLLEGPERRARAVVITLTAVLVIVAGAATVARNRVWRSEETLWENVVATAPQSSRAQGNYGHSLLSAGRMVEAEPHLRESLRLMPSYPYALLMLGTWILRVGDTNASIAYFDRAIATDPNLFYAYYMRGLAGEYSAETAPQLVNYFARACAISPTFADAWYHQALALDKAGEPARAVASAARAVELRGSYDDRFMLAYALLKNGDAAGAKAWFLALQKERPDDPAVKTDLALVEKALNP